MKWGLSGILIGYTAWPVGRLLYMVGLMAFQEGLHASSNNGADTVLKLLH